MSTGQGSWGLSARERDDRAAVDDELVDLIDATVLGEKTWFDFLRRLSQTLPDGKSTLFYHDVSKRQGAWELTAGFSNDAVSDYATHYSKINPWMRAAAVRPVGKGVVADQMLPAAELCKTEFFNDFFSKKTGLSAVGLTIMREEGRPLLLSLGTEQADPDANLEAADRLTRLSLHLQRAFRFFRNGPADARLGDFAHTLFDAVDIGVIILGEGGVVKITSAAGARMVGEGSTNCSTPIGKIRLRSPEANAMLSSMLGRSFHGPKVSRFIIDGMKVTLVRIEKDRFSAYFEGPTVVLLLERLAARVRDVSVLDRTYGLTKAEMRSLAGLVSGMNVSQIAEDAALSRETIRTQIKSLYAKVGVRSQVGLMRLISVSGLSALVKGS